MCAKKAVSVAAGGYSWQLLNSIQAPSKGNVSQCSSFFKQACAANSTIHDSATALMFTDPSRSMRAPEWETDLAAFLLVRGPFAWIGHGWFGCANWNEPVGGHGQIYERPKELDVDFGEPTEQCYESGPDVFTRQWSKATVEYNCKTATARIASRL